MQQQKKAKCLLYHDLGINILSKGHNMSPLSYTFLYFSNHDSDLLALHIVKDYSNVC